MELCEHGPARSSKPLVQWCERTFRENGTSDHVTLNAASHLCKDGTDQDIPAPHRGKHGRQFVLNSTRHRKPVQLSYERRSLQTACTMNYCGILYPLKSLQDRFRAARVETVTVILPSTNATTRARSEDGPRNDAPVSTHMILQKHDLCIHWASHRSGHQDYGLMSMLTTLCHGKTSSLSASDNRESCWLGQSRDFRLGSIQLESNNRLMSMTQSIIACLP